MPNFTVNQRIPERSRLALRPPTMIKQITVQLSVRVLLKLDTFINEQSNSKRKIVIELQLNLNFATYVINTKVNVWYAFTP